jgi:hypothetical protein
MVVSRAVLHEFAPFVEFVDFVVFVGFVGFVGFLKNLPFLRDRHMWG